MKIRDNVFGELEFDYIWHNEMQIIFLKETSNITLMVKGDEDGEFDAQQYEAYESLLLKWDQIQEDILEPILNYYSSERIRIGYHIQENEHFPLIEKCSQLIDMIKIEAIVVSYADSYDGRDIGILFECSWDDENGLGIRLIDEEIIDIGYQDIAI